MKNLIKIFVILGFLPLFFASSAFADEVIHGIDVDKVFAEGDWSSKEKIKELINDYTLLLEYQKEFDSCPDVLPKILGCYDKVAEKIITNLYVYPEHNLQEYKNLKNALSDAYGMKNCREKHNWPGGQMCEVDRMSDMSNALRRYIQDLIDTARNTISRYHPFLKQYK